MVSSGMDVESVDWSDISDLLLGRLSLPSLQPISQFGNGISNGVKSNDPWGLVEEQEEGRPIQYCFLLQPGFAQGGAQARKCCWVFVRRV
jgi:hypothetical protein